MSLQSKIWCGINSFITGHVFNCFSSTPSLHPNISLLLFLSLLHSLSTCISLFIYFSPSIYVSGKCVRNRKDKLRGREKWIRVRWSKAKRGRGKVREGGARAREGGAWIRQGRVGRGRVGLEQFRNMSSFP